MLTVTLDHNCLIDLANGTDVGKEVRAVVDSEETECFVVNIGASEMLERGILADRYDLFEEFLASIGLSDLPRIDPLGIMDITFWDHCVFAGDDDSALVEEIQSILFPESATEAKKALNQACDVHSMWCHISRGNDVFLTSDTNFMKQSKLPRLIELGAKAIRHPGEPFS